MQTDQRRRVRRRERRRRRRQSEDPPTPQDSRATTRASGTAPDTAAAGATANDTAAGDSATGATTQSDPTDVDATTGAAPTDDEEHPVAVALERLIWTIMSSFSLLLAGGAAVLTVRTDGPVAVGLALAAVVVAVSAAYFLYHMWRAPEDAQEF